MILSFFVSPYFSVMWIVLNTPSSTRSYFAMYPSSRRMFAIAIFILDAGTSTVSCFAVLALRILVSISAIGSVIVMLVSSYYSLLRLYMINNYFSFIKFAPLPSTKLDLRLHSVSLRCGKDLALNSLSAQVLEFIKLLSAYQLAFLTPGI